VNVKDFLDEFSQWARTQTDIEAVALVGSYARDDPKDDSDVDLIVLTTTPARYFRDQSWASLFGKVGERKVESWGRVKSLRVSYSCCLEVEYSFAIPAWAGIPVDAGTHEVIRNGMKILFDPRDLLKALQPSVDTSIPRKN